MGRARGAFGKGEILVMAAAIVATGGSVGSATMIGGTEFDIAYWAGSGANQAVLVIDFLASGGDSHCFGYRWDGSATGYDMVQAVAAAGDLDFTATTYPGMGVFIDNFFYGSEAGNVDLYWQYFTGTASGGGVAWTAASEGMSTRVLTDGAIDGWYNGFDGHVPRVPEPATALLLAAGAVSLTRRTRRPA